MKFMKQSGMYKASNVCFNPKTLSAHSYEWWRFVAVVDGKVIFNNYRYSPTTQKHQIKVRRLLEELKIKIDFILPSPLSIGIQSLEELILQSEEHLCDKFLEEEIKKQERYQRVKERKLQSLIEAQKPTLALVETRETVEA